MKIVSDEPSLAGVLDFDKYSQGLTDIITNSTPKFCIGVFGEWGTGKTTLMKMIERRIKDQDNILVVWFEPWKYEKEKHLAVLPFIRTMEIELENKQLRQLQGTSNSNTGLKWHSFRKSLERTFNAFVESTTLNLGISSGGSSVSGGTSLAKFRDVYK